MLSDERRRWEYDQFEYAQLHGGPVGSGGISPDAFDAMDAFVSTAPSGHPFVWESSFDSARRAAAGRRGGPGRASTFDPFELFNAMFARDFHEMDAMDRGAAGSPGEMADPFFSHGGFGSMMSPPSFGGMSPFGGFGGMGMGPGPGAMAGPSGMGGMFGGAGGSPFNMIGGFPPTHTTQGGQSTYSSSTSSFGSSSNRGNTFETRRTSVVNGRRETVITKRDANGDETVRRITPDGETVFVNGQLQQTIGAAPEPAVSGMLPESTQAPMASEPEPEPRSTAPPRRKKWGIF